MLYSSLKTYYWLAAALGDVGNSPLRERNLSRSFLLFIRSFWKPFQSGACNILVRGLWSYGLYSWVYLRAGKESSFGCMDVWMYYGPSCCKSYGRGLIWSRTYITYIKNLVLGCDTSLMLLSSCCTEQHKLSLTLKLEQYRRFHKTHVSTVIIPRVWVNDSCV